jgi:hypothetical protein
MPPLSGAGAMERPTPARVRCSRLPLLYPNVQQWPNRIPKLAVRNQIDPATTLRSNRTFENESRAVPTERTSSGIIHNLPPAGNVLAIEPYCWKARCLITTKRLRESNYPPSHAFSLLVHHANGEVQILDWFCQTRTVEAKFDNAPALRCQPHVSLPK